MNEFEVYYEVTMADGTKGVAYGAPKSYVASCLAGTGAVFAECTEEQAQKINCYYNVNGGSGWDCLHMTALTAKIKYYESTHTNTGA